MKPPVANHRPGIRCRGKHRGVTLVDLVVTVLIMAIVSAVATPRFTGMLAGYRVETAARQIAADLNYARQYARQTSQAQTVEFTIDPPGYVLLGVPSLDKPGADVTVNLNDHGYGVRLGSVSFDGQTSLTFDQYGRPFGGTSSTPLASGTIGVISGGDSQNVVIDLNTGKAETP